MVCQNCSKEIDQDSSFCKHCGTSMNVCQICKKELDVDSKFCKHCGAAREATSLTRNTYTTVNAEASADIAPTELDAKEEVKGRNNPLALLFVVAIMISILYVALNPGVLDSIATYRPDSVSSSKSAKITLAEYNQIDMGMTYDRVKSIVGSAGEELTRTQIAGYTTFIVVWEGVGGNGANANVTFQNGEAIAKAQIGLK